MDAKSRIAPSDKRLEKESKEYKKRGKVKEEFLYLFPSLEDLDDEYRPKEYVWHDPGHRFEESMKLSTTERVKRKGLLNPVLSLAVAGLLGLTGAIVYNLYRGRLEVAEKIRNYSMHTQVLIVAALVFGPGTSLFVKDTDGQWRRRTVVSPYMEKGEYEKMKNEEIDKADNGLVFSDDGLKK
ncbi:uncharacterized protein LOC106155434 [Lingula anatina]|uniref:Uncharacterized protein LOC106155434 n=1 Tax=Lingula anatina TaxID=7574 RepID=A0A1S3HI15_LINAN|nr:uncharacterized protein LOC106155434 [Lingula anatina]|eukprot:XP_013385750.1 uncharacterized protein LOC106155434 [Lingula anatina]